MNHQDHSHREGQQNNISVPGQGQHDSHNNTQQLSDMGNESQEQRSGPAHGQKDESGVQQDERQP
jgi:hypothetical protein